jgi:iron(III) transport system ATP-binding protein
VLDNGVVQQVGTPAELYDFPVNGFVAGFVGTMNMLVGSIAHLPGGSATLQVDGVPDLPLPRGSEWPAGSRVAASFRPHTLRLEAAPDAGDRPADPTGALADAGDAGRRGLWIRGVVQAREFSGEFTRYRVAVGGQSITADQGHRAGSVLFAGGAAVIVGIDPGEIRLLPASQADEPGQGPAW